MGIGASADYSVGSPDSAQTSIINIERAVVAHHRGHDRLAGRVGHAHRDCRSGADARHAGELELRRGRDARYRLPQCESGAGHSRRPQVGERDGETISSTEIEPSHHIVVSITPSPTSYAVSSPGSAVITILGATGDNTLPIATLRSATTFLTKGGAGTAGGGVGGASYPVTISLTKAVTTPLTIVLAYGGNAQQGIDFTLPGGSIVIPPGETSLTVQVPIVHEQFGRVESGVDRGARAGRRIPDRFSEHGVGDDRVRGHARAHDLGQYRHRWRREARRRSRSRRIRRR